MKKFLWLDLIEIIIIYLIFNLFFIMQNLLPFLFKKKKNLGKNKKI